MELRLWPLLKIIQQKWRDSQVVRRGSAKPLFVGSIPTRASTNNSPRFGGGVVSWNLGIERAKRGLGKTACFSQKPRYREEGVTWSDAMRHDIREGSRSEMRTQTALCSNARRGAICIALRCSGEPPPFPHGSPNVCEGA